MGPVSRRVTGSRALRVLGLEGLGGVVVMHVLAGVRVSQSSITTTEVELLG